MVSLSFMLDLAIVSLVAGISGWICRRIHVSVVVGYLVAGVVIGPYTPPFQLVSDADRVKMLADLGLVFLVFAIGLGLSLGRLQRLGLSVILGTAASALLVMAGARVASALAGYDDTQGLFIAAVVMVSSSAIISKVLEEVGMNHQRPGQLALGVTLLEDIVAIVMLTLLSSIAAFGGEKNTSLFETISAFSGFVVIFTVVILLIVPKLLRWMDHPGTDDLRMLVIAGLLLLLGWLMVKMEYSLALAAFLLGVVIGGTPQRPQVEQLFEGLRHWFGSIFFVAMGMLFDVRSLGSVWHLVAGLVVLAIVVRVPAVALGMLLIGNRLRDSLRTGFAVTPLGEFSFIIAFLGVQSKLMPEGFYPAAIGASLITCLIAPVLIRQSEALSARVESLVPGAVLRLVESYHARLARLQSRQQSSFVWKLTAPRLLQISIQILLVSGCIVLARPLYAIIVPAATPEAAYSGMIPFVLACGFGLLILAPLVAVWRNVDALAMILAEAATLGDPQSARFGPLVHKVIAGASLVGVALWISALLPADVLSSRATLGVVLVLVAAAILLWKRLVYWHSRFEGELHEELATATRETRHAGWSLASLRKGEEWRVLVQDVSLASDAKHAGRTIRELDLRHRWGCSILGIDRGGFAINNPGPDERLYPGDRLLLLGTADQIAPARSHLLEREPEPSWQQDFSEFATQSVSIPAGSPAEGRTLAELELARRFSIQIGGVRRHDGETLTASGDRQLLEGDQVLVLGTHRSIGAFQDWIETPAGAAAIQPST